MDHLTWISYQKVKCKLIINLQAKKSIKYKFNINIFRTGNPRNLTCVLHPKANEPSSVLDLYYPVFFKFGVMTVLDTDYKNYAVVTLVSSVIGPM